MRIAVLVSFPQNTRFMKEKMKDPSAIDAEEPKEAEVFQSLIIEDVKYKTRLNKKFLNRKIYEPLDPKKILSFIPGTIINVFVKNGTKVKTGDKLLELEAMKMVNTVFAEYDGMIMEVHVKTGDLVSKNQLLIKFR